MKTQLIFSSMIQIFPFLTKCQTLIFFLHKVVKLIIRINTKPIGCIREINTFTI